MRAERRDCGQRRKSMFVHYLTLLPLLFSTCLFKSHLSFFVICLFTPSFSTLCNVNINFNKSVWPVVVDYIKGIAVHICSS